MFTSKGVFRRWGVKKIWLSKDFRKTTDGDVTKCNDGLDDDEHSYEHLQLYGHGWILG